MTKFDSDQYDSHLPLAPATDRDECLKQFESSISDLAIEMLEAVMGIPDYKTIMADLETIVCDYLLKMHDGGANGLSIYTTLRFRIYSDGRIEREVI